MSFASEARAEIAARLPDTEAGVRAACYGLACFAKHFDARGLVIQTEQAETAGYAMQCFARCGVQGGVCRREHASGPVYEFKIEDAACVARMHALFGTTGRETSLQIDPGLIRSRDSLSAYVGAAFLCCGTVTDPQKGYHLEFTTPGPTWPGILRPCWPNMSLPPAQPPQGGQRHLSESLRQHPGPAGLYGGRAGRRPDEQRAGRQIGPQPGQPVHQLRDRQPGQDGAGQCVGHPGPALSAGTGRAGRPARAAARDGGQTAGVSRAVSGRFV